MMNQNQLTASSISGATSAGSGAGTGGNSRKRARENETPQQRAKREKAAERQRRKRERDRAASQQNNQNMLLAQQHQHQQQVQGIPPPPPTTAAPPPQHPHVHLQHPQQLQHQPGQPQPQMQTPGGTISAPAALTEQKNNEMSPEEQARLERVRAAARERQRKHRAMVKQKKLRELGLDMGNDIVPPSMEEVHYHQGQYAPAVMPHEVPPPPPPPQHAPPQHQHPHSVHEPSFPHGQPPGGVMFASTLLLSFSCVPLLKQHLLRTLNMTNEELASLEPIIAQAWDHWDSQRRMYGHPGPNTKPPDGTDHAAVAAAAAAAAAVSNQYAAAAAAAAAATMPDHTLTHPFVNDPNQASNDFRSRFARSIVAPPPFRAMMPQHPPPPDQQQQQQQAQQQGHQGGQQPNGAPSQQQQQAQQANVQQQGQNQQPEALDPALTTKTPGNAMAIDPQLGQGRDEAGDGGTS